jgi:phage shock protein E
MISRILELLGLKKAIDFKAMVAAGAQIVDVRSAGEFAGGNVPGSVNMPLDALIKHAQKLDKSKPVITCCASGMRSGVGAGVLRNAGFNEVVNGGGWYSLLGKLTK